MKNFPFNWTVDGQERELWYSRSVAVGLFVFAQDNKGEWYILASKRGTASPFSQGLWNCPGGFVDFNETFFQAAHRECWEETGVIIPTNDINFHSFNSVPDSKRQTISMRMYAIYDKKSGKTVENLEEQITFAHNEENECTEIKFIPIKDIDSYKWAFMHNKIIPMLFDRVVLKKYSLKTKIKRALRILYSKEPLYLYDKYAGT